MAAIVSEKGPSEEKTVFCGSLPEDMAYAKTFWQSIQLLPPMESRLVSSDIKQRLKRAPPGGQSANAAYSAKEIENQDNNGKNRIIERKRNSKLLSPSTISLFTAKYKKLLFKLGLGPQNDSDILGQTKLFTIVQRKCWADGNKSVEIVCSSVAVQTFLAQANEEAKAERFYRRQKLSNLRDEDRALLHKHRQIRMEKEKIAFQPGVGPERRQDHMDLAIGDSDNEVDDSNDAKQSLKDIDKFDRKLKSRNDRPDDSDSD